MISLLVLCLVDFLAAQGHTRSFVLGECVPSMRTGMERDLLFGCNAEYPTFFLFLSKLMFYISCIK